ncbi:MAG: EAL domain-containing protein [Betaproteobacteria bacterium]|nr:EAL domain-containing protein [Betaproteobacteria bacterium]
MTENEIIQGLLFFLLGFGLAAVSALVLFVLQRWKGESRMKEVDEEIHLLTAAFHEFPQPMCITRMEDGAILNVNQAFEEDFGWKRSDIIGKSTMEIGGWQNEKQREAYRKRVNIGKRLFYFATEFIDGHNRMRHSALTAHAFRAFNNDEQLVITSFFDRTAQKQAEDLINQENSRFRDLFHNLRDAAARCDNRRNFIEGNQAFLDSVGYTMEELRRMTPADITPPEMLENDDRIEDELCITSENRAVVYEKEHIRKDGSRFPVELQLYPLRDGQGNMNGFWGIARDLSERVKQQEKLDFLSHYDQLTKLPNRALLINRIKSAIEHIQRSENQKKLALFFVDLDRLKNINDTFGHQVGDALLCAVAGKMQRLLRGGDTLARLGSDEFVILLENSSTSQSISIVVKRLSELFEQPIIMQEQEIYITASIGVSIYPDDGDNVDTLLRCANVAMLKAKAQGRNTWQFYERDMQGELPNRLLLSNFLRNALQRHELLLRYQPVLDISTGRLVGVEALVRWLHPEQGLMLPEQFIPLAEDMGIITSIDNWVLQEACQQMRYWHTKGFNVPRISVNLSAQQLERSGLVDFVRQQLEKNSLSPELLELEITESTLTQWLGNALTNMRGLRDLGVVLSVDNFGTGFSSLTNLKNMPVHKLKIDYSFIRDIGRSKNDEAVASAIIAVAKRLSLDIVAECIEHKEQEDFLLAEGCLVGQGFYYAEALPADKLLAQWKGKSDAGSGEADD